MSYPADLRYTKSHEWVRLEGDVATVGISAHAQEALGDIVFVDLPEVGDDFDAEESCCEVESVKAVSDVYCPLSGTIAAVNEDLEDNEEIVNKAPYGEGWLFQVKVSDPSDVDALLDAAAYQALVEAEG